MRPISLKLAGLHSFREPQVVDFEQLCQAGLFGIFGPTGSGKSTVLDAITLALYDRVERASHGKQGIINHAEDRILVEFTFEIDHPEGRRRYRVERLYRRSGENTVNSKSARLIEINDGEERPLASEKKRVDEEIEALLGLTVDDFTRAVVLPQGKFDEFLKKIKPIERRRMLERLFGLSEYGDRLKQKVDSRLGGAVNSLASIQGELDGLGDASDEALETSRKQLEEFARLADSAGKIMQQTEKDSREMEQVWNWQEDKAGVDQSLQNLRERGAEIEALQKKLDAAQRAGKLLPYLQEADEAEKSYEDARVKHAQITERLVQAGQAAEAAESAYNAARRQRQAEEPGLLEKKAWLARALELEKQAGGLKEDMSRAAKDLSVLEGHKETNTAALMKLQSYKISIEQDIVRLKGVLDRSRVDPARRKRVSLSLLALQKWQNAEKERQLASADRQKKENLLSQKSKDLAGAQAALQESLSILEGALAREKQQLEACPADEATLQGAFRELDSLRFQTGTVAALHNSIKEASALLINKNNLLELARKTADRAGKSLSEALKLRDEARGLAQGLEEKIAGLRRRNMACHLARSLEKGAACPVCGSKDHPAPAVTGEAADMAAVEEEFGEALAGAEKAQQALEKIQREESAGAEKLNSARASAQEARDRLDILKAEMDTARGSLPADLISLPPEELAKELASREAGLAVSRQRLEEWQKKLEEIRLAVKAADNACNNAKVAQAGARSTCLGAESAWREACAREQDTGTEAGRYLSYLDSVRGDLAADKIQEEQGLIDLLDGQRSGLEKDLAGLEERLSETSREADSLTALDSDLSVRLYKKQADLTALQGQLNQKEGEITTITGGQPAGVLLEKTEARLKGLLESDQKTREEMKAASEVKGLLDQALAAADNALDTARERLNTGLARLNESLDKLHFVTRREAGEAVLSDPEQQEIRQQVEDHLREIARLADLSRSLEEKLAGRNLTTEEWQDCRERLESARQEREKALTARGAAAAEYEKLTENNTRWRDLSLRAAETGSLKAKLSILKELLRGNAFVDFLAEEQLIRVAGDASARLGQLTKHRYALEVDSEGGFIIRDEANGGVKRPVSTLSGGETFVTSLALALALSAQIQLKGRYPLEFFFLDEGFGTLDPDLLEVVVSTLERLRLDHLNIGIISHVPELKNRLPRRLVIEPAEASGAGSRLTLEMA